MQSNTAAAASGTSNARLVEALTFAAAIIVVVIALVNGKLDYDRITQITAERAQAQAVSMATDVRWYVDVARQTLRRVSLTVQGLPQSQVPSLLRDNALDLPMGVVIMIYDADGKIVGRTTPTGQQVSIADREYFLDIKRGKDWSISNLLVDRTTGSKTFAVAIPLKQDEQFRGALVAYAPMSVFAAAWLGASGRDSNAFIVHEEGWISARLPTVESDVYDTNVSQEFVQRFAGSRGAFLAEPSPIDGIARVLGYAKVPSTPLIAVVGLGNSEQLEPFWRQIALITALLLPMLALLFYGSHKVRRLIAQNELASAGLAKSLERNESLLLEIHHRVKNNLQSVSSLVRLHVKDAAAGAEIDRRIAGMAAVHEHIYKHETFSNAGAREFIKSISKKVLYATSADHELIFDLENPDLDDDKLMPIGQLLTEALINAGKYGYPDGRNGVVTIGLKQHGDVAELTVHNDGMPLGTPSQQGLGSRLMRSFADQLDGKLNIISDGTGVTVKATFPVA